TAREGISLLEQIIYIADCISFDRDYDDAHAIRERIRSSLDSAMLCALALTIKGLVKKESPIHTDTVKAYNSFLPAAE
ncbi:MAG: HD domain-containing protein, partial [Acetanaerobacterium sp.]